jgi:hypothetical protein
MYEIENLLRQLPEKQASVFLCQLSPHDITAFIREVLIYSTVNKFTLSGSLDL